jgi:hypothetical protein
VLRPQARVTEMVFNRLISEPSIEGAQLLLSNTLESDHRRLSGESGPRAAPLLAVGHGAQTTT